MSTIDVRDLSQESLPKGRFPAQPDADFRLYLAPEAHRGILEHAQQDVSVEICGVLVGRWERDEDGPYAVASDYIRCDNAASKFAEVTFTHESWAKINEEMDTRFADARIIGWYHSHPDFGIFLSDRDCFIHEHFFSGPGQVALVVDPVRELEGVFTWQKGKPAPLAHYWIGDKICAVEASRTSAADRGDRPPSDEGAGDVPRRRDGSTLAFTTTMLSWIALFLLGYLWAGLQTRWQREMILEGAVAHYGFNKLMKLGLEENLDNVRLRLTAVRDEFRRLPTSDEGLSDEQVQEVAKKRKLIADTLSLCTRQLAAIEQEFGLSDEERDASMRLITEKIAQLRSQTKRPAGSPAAGAASGSPPSGGASSTSGRNTADDLFAPLTNETPTTDASPPSSE